MYHTIKINDMTYSEFELHLKNNKQTVYDYLSNLVGSKFSDEFGTYLISEVSNNFVFYGNEKLLSYKTFITKMLSFEIVINN